jgi:hypothetical protein
MGQFRVSWARNVIRQNVFDALNMSGVEPDVPSAEQLGNDTDQLLALR